MAYIVVGRRARSREYKDFPYKENMELMPSRDWGYSPFWEGENRVVGSLCVVRKMFPYTNMCVDHIRPCRICWYASSISKGHLST